MVSLKLLLVCTLGLACIDISSSSSTDSTPAPTDIYTQWFTKTLEAARLYYKNHPEEIPSGESVNLMAIKQPEYIDCMKYDERFGVKDFDPKFKKEWGVKEECRCCTIVKRVKSGEIKIVVPQWSEDYDSSFVRTNSTGAHRRRLAMLLVLMNEVE